MDLLITASQAASISTEVLAYMQHVVTFLRMHRAVGGGVTPRATRLFKALVRCMVSLHGLEYATPSLVALATRKIYRHRLHIIKPEKDRSMQYGSDAAAINGLLRNVTAELVIEEVLLGVEAPL